MTKYYINDTDLSNFGITVEALTGFENFPKRKGVTEHNYLNQNGVEAFTDEDEVFYESRDLTLSLLFEGDTVIQIQERLSAFFSFISIGELTINMSYSTNSYVCYFKAGAKSDRKTKNINGKQYYAMDLVLTEIDPTSNEPYVPPEPVGEITIEVVESLPSVGENNKIYAILKSSSMTNNRYTEYIFIDAQWELIGDNDDLTSYATTAEVNAAIQLEETRAKAAELSLRNSIDAFVAITDTEINNLF